ncbi:MAG: hypothetical protein U0361_02135 [Nitrospiraceae bacterium]
MAVLYNKPGIILAMLFVTMPFTIRSLQPVLMGLDRDREGNLHAWGRRYKTTFWKVTVPSVLQDSDRSLSHLRAGGSAGDPGRS